VGPVDALKDITRQRLLKLPAVGRSKGRKIGCLSAVKSFAKLPHTFWNRQIANPHFTQIGVEIAAKPVE